MNKENENTIVVAGGIIAALLFMSIRKKTPVETILSAAADLIISFEGFRSKPYWDVKRYSWGYGTMAPGRFGTITRAKAYEDLMRYVKTDYDKLVKLIRVPLTVNQWASLLSFSYNLGFGNVDNLVPNINAKNWGPLKRQWVQYKYADGEEDAGLLARRERELKNFFM